MRPLDKALLNYKIKGKKTHQYGFFTRPEFFAHFTSLLRCKMLYFQNKPLFFLIYLGQINTGSF